MSATKINNLTGDYTGTYSLVGPGIEPTTFHLLLSLHHCHLPLAPAVSPFKHPGPLGPSSGRQQADRIANQAFLVHKCRDLAGFTYIPVLQELPQLIQVQYVRDFCVVCSSDNKLILI